MASSNNHTKTKIITITVPTKQHDGGSNSDRANRVIHAAAAPQQKPDAFTKYSSNLIRMKELLLLSDNNEEGEGKDWQGGRLGLPFIPQLRPSIRQYQ